MTVTRLIVVICMSMCPKSTLWTTFYDPTYSYAGDTGLRVSSGDAHRRGDKYDSQTSSEILSAKDNTFFHRIAAPCMESQRDIVSYLKPYQYFGINTQADSSKTNCSYMH